MSSIVLATIQQIILRRDSRLLAVPVFFFFFTVKGVSGRRCLALPDG